MKIQALPKNGRLRTGLLVCLAAGLGAATAPAHADTMLLADTTLVTGSASDTFSFNAPTAGTITANITNLPMGSPLSTLNFEATDAANVLSSDSVPASAKQTFQVGPGTYFAHIMATAGGGLNVGAYSLSLSFSPNAVPLPGSAWLLLGGALFVCGVVRIGNAAGELRLRPPSGHVGAARA